jgi:hypothetical protein
MSNPRVFCLIDLVYCTVVCATKTAVVVTCNSDVLLGSYFLIDLYCAAKVSRKLKLFVGYHLGL